MSVPTSLNTLSQVDTYSEEHQDQNHGKSCNYCSKYWGRGRLGEMEAHLANTCSEVPNDIKDYWQEILASKINNYKRTNNTKSSNLKQHNKI
ncbi:hypothetical protein RhiirA5_408994 [Rhizophagus irregularis]|uniref:BED-type domain-containing protein n=2 Tax=Rhizophagus irregularis TaxID=588596 RepID=U9TMG7_RHIID|nr:hypothetical protein GLOIN_2v1770960 [Rhizophagus irregularis DAOM 181602=DAOM 197198]PKC14808.1 hypothetical protein RhiirA5_408994 [Rhizophagus irregularis]PKC58580.1 hypothetical protein RhiirA1_470761 [Rhizophagus irregularis]PKY13719.1 hypothetical protein RhiirB3_425594 [Rhizophagus irregularis]POG74710.1 hypothetical protein GLOIN_2v1770960 [Rhizophagus irregularis DAOM 181602=DAOM 197198]CAB5368023.1 unnamed protein product [Rhizophagus irregularis]|eukprot:XP_025181576.1 hypothetical protein GLOIN_2v1770960 [Rhizophagus irregularis DAOM 181602=DAOM 197198]